jgi:hypothetical protein
MPFAQGARLSSRRASTMEAISRYAAIRAAFNAFPAADEVEARKELEAAKIVGFSESLQINKALSVVRAFLNKLDEWERDRQAG